MKHLKSTENKKSKLPLLAGMLLIIASLLVTTKLVQKAQDTRSSAANEYCTYGSKKCFGNSLGTCKQTSVHTYWSKSPCRYGCANNKCKPDPNIIKPTCTSFTYGSWSICTNGKQTRKVTSKSPSGCTGGSTVTSRSCTVPTCTSFTYGSWSICTNGKQTRKVTGASPYGCAGGNSVTSQSCTSGGSSVHIGPSGPEHGGGGRDF